MTKIIKNLPKPPKYIYRRNVFSLLWIISYFWKFWPEKPKKSLFGQNSSLLGQNRPPNFLCFIYAHTVFLLCEVDLLKVNREKETLPIYCEFKGAQSYFSKLGFLFHLKNHHSKVIWIETVKPIGCMKQFCDLQSPISYFVSYYGYHNQARFYQYLSNRTYFSCKIWHELREKYELSCDTKPQKIWNKLKK